MSEKKEMIKNGEDVSLDGGNVIVLNGVSVAEKKQELETETKAPETAEEDAAIVVPEETTQDNTDDTPAPEPVLETPETPKVPEIDLSSLVPPTEEPVIPVPTTEVEVPEIPVTNVMDTVPNFPNPEVSFEPTPISFDTVAQTPTYDEEQPQNSFEVPTYGNFMGNYPETQDILPTGVKKAVEMVENETLEIVRENSELKEENVNLKNKINDLNEKLSKAEAKNEILNNKISSMQNSMTAAQSRILDVFGMGGMNNVSGSNVSNFSQQSYNDDQSNNNGMGMAA